MNELSRIQKELKAPKGQRNKFGNYNYRSCEDILEAVKPLLNGACLTIEDEIVLIGDRFYVKATATLRVKDSSISASAYAREPLSKKGMDEAQITGATSSYARKYALNGLFCIDDTKDSDATNTHNKSQNTASNDNEKLTEIRNKLSAMTNAFQDKDVLGRIIKELGYNSPSDLKNCSDKELDKILEIL